MTGVPFGPIAGGVEPGWPGGARIGVPLGPITGVAGVVPRTGVPLLPMTDAPVTPTIVPSGSTVGVEATPF
jgi:hypothetical protein